jgi:hypothetical protein
MHHLLGAEGGTKSGRVAVTTGVRPTRRSI